MKNVNYVVEVPLTHLVCARIPQTKQEHIPPCVPIRLSVVENADDCSTDVAFNNSVFGYIHSKVGSKTASSDEEICLRWCPPELSAWYGLLL